MKSLNLQFEEGKDIHYEDILNGDFGFDKNHSVNFSDFGNGSSLSYDPERFNRETSGYISEQLGLHKIYSELKQEELIYLYEDLDELFRDETENEKYLDTLPDYLVRPRIEMHKLYLATKRWAKFKTLRGDIQQFITEEKVIDKAYKIGEVIIDYGKSFLEERFSSSKIRYPKIKKIFEEWFKVQKDLSSLYSRLSITQNKKVRAWQRLYDLYFPDN